MIESGGERWEERGGEIYGDRGRQMEGETQREKMRNRGQKNGIGR
jgi:hypothetical protein